MLLLFRGVNWLPVKCDPDNHEIHLQTPHIFELKQFHKSFRGTHRYLRVCTCDTSSLITAVMLHEGRWRVTRNGFTESAQKPTDVFCGTSALYVFPILHWWTPPPEQMNQWNFGISMNKLISVFVGCQGLRSRLQKLVYNKLAKNTEALA